MGVEDRGRRREGTSRVRGPADDQVPDTPITPAPTPDEVRASMLVAVEQMRSFLAEYRAAYEQAYEPAVLGDGGRTQRGTSNPTESVFEGKARRRIRATLRSTAGKMIDARSKVDEARSMLRKAVDRSDGIDAWADEKRMVRDESAQRFRRTAEAADLTDARAAQERRRERGEA